MGLPRRFAVQPTPGDLPVKIKTALITAALVLGTVATAQAADKRSSLSLSGNITVPEEGDTSGNVFFSYGFMVTPSIELEGTWGQTFSRGETSAILGFVGKYYFSPVGRGGAVLPYVKAGALVLVPDQGDNATGWQAGAGLEFAFNESASTFFEASYNNTKVNSFTSKDVQLNVGIKLRF